MVIKKSIKVNNNTYKVTKIKRGILKGNNKVKTIIIYVDNIKSIEKESLLTLNRLVIKLKGPKKKKKKVKKLIIKSVIFKKTSIK